MSGKGGESPRLTWGVDGFGKRHYICEFSGAYLGVMTNAEHFDFEEENCAKCEAGNGKGRDAQKAVSLANHGGQLNRCAGQQKNGNR